MFSLPDDVMLLLSTWAFPKYVQWSTTVRKREGGVQVEGTHLYLTGWWNSYWNQTGWQIHLVSFEKNLDLWTLLITTIWAVSLLLSPFQLSPFNLQADFMMEQKCQSIEQPSAGRHHQSALASWASFQRIIYNTWIITETLLLSAHSSPYNFLLLFFWQTTLKF